jgi:hypothetical protein
LFFAPRISNGYACGVNQIHERTAAPQRPVAMGCALAAMTIVCLVGAIVFAVIFFDSGATSGKVQMEAAEAYAVGSIEFFGARNFYLVRISSREFIALSDLDAANRLNPQRRCRVSPLPRDDPALPRALERFENATNPAARGSTIVFGEGCNGALYDVTGLRLSGEGQNLDRYPVAFNSTGHLTVDVSKRICSERVGAELFAEIECEQ